MKIRHKLIYYLISVAMAFSFFDAAVSSESFNENHTKASTAHSSSQLSLPVNADDFVEEIYLGKTLRHYSVSLISRNDNRCSLGFRHPRLFTCISLQNLFSLFVMLCLLRILEIKVSVNHHKIIKYIHDMDGQKD